MAEILRGSPAADAIIDDLILRTEKLKARGIKPCLAILRVGENESDKSYERGASKRCTRIGIELKNIVLPADCTQAELMDTIDRINEDATIHGCLMFRPLPQQLNEAEACERLKPAKDVDGMTAASLSKVFTGTGEGYSPCTAQACIEILDYYGYELKGKNAAVIGRSLVIGRPVSMLLMQRNATVTICHSQTQDMPSLCRGADILVVATGKSGMIDESYVNQNQVIIDVGINVNADGSIHGDVNFESVEDKVHAISPVPGGVGAVTTAVLCKHVIEAAEKSS